MGDSMEVDELKSELLTVINDRQEVTYNELLKIASTRNLGEAVLKQGLKELEKMNAIASRSSGGIPTYYVLQEQEALRRIMIVEDDKNINKLMSLSVGKEFDITQIYDGREAIQRIRNEKPDLVILDLMLPGADGLDICQTVKRDPSVKDTIIIIVSAMDATSNRFKGIENGADYYIKKPFDPDELKSLVTIFLKKKGKRFDPLIDLPNEEKISNAVDKAVQTQGSYQIGKIRVNGLAEFARVFGNQSGVTILRLISQLLQDKVKELGEGSSNLFIGFLDNEDFVVAGDSGTLSKLVAEIEDEFKAVLPFIHQSAGYKPIERGIEDTYGAEKPQLSLSYSEISKAEVIKKRAEVLKDKQEKRDEANGKGIGAYTYEELRHMLGSDDLDVIITRDTSGVKLAIGKSTRKEK